MSPHSRSASLSVKQAIGILLVLFAAMWLFADVCTCFIFLIGFSSGEMKFNGLPALVGIVIGLSLVLIFVIVLVIIGIRLIRDKQGFDWGTLRDGMKF